MLSTQNNTNLFNSANTNQHRDLNENRILSDQQRLNDKTPAEAAVEASRQDDDDVYVMLDDSDEENADNQNNLVAERVDNNQDSVQDSNQESAQPNGRRLDDDQANSQANDPADSRPDSRTGCATDSAADHPPDDDPVQIKQEPNEELTDRPSEQPDADDDALFEIIDGILLYSFKTEEDLRKFTEEDESKKEKQTKLDKKELKAKRGRRKEIVRCTLAYSADRRKSSIGKQPQPHNQSQDSAFVSPELDDYLSRKFKSDRSRLSLDENAANDLSFGESFDPSFGACRKSKGKPSKKSSPEIVSVNEAISELDDDERIDNDVAYRRCIRSVEKAYNSVQEKMRGKFEPIPLDYQRVRMALGALHQNFISPSVSSSVSSSIYSPSAFECSTDSKAATAAAILESELPTELDLDRARSNLENISKPRSSGDILFKIEPAEENNLSQIKTLKQVVTEPEDKQRKKNRNEEEGYDITRIISKHSKRDIRLPARFHESGILVGSQWILPDFDENKSRTTSNRKQPTNRKKSTGKSLKTDLANSINSFETETTSTAAISQLESEPLNPENLMSEDEDSLPCNEPSASANLASNSLSSTCNYSPTNHESASHLTMNSATDDKSAKKRKFLKQLWRDLFYANNSKRRAYYAERSILPRVNKFKAIREGCRTIENLKKQVKNRNYCENSLITWQNKLKLTLASIEKSNGSLSAEELNEIEKTLNAYRNSLKKVDQVLAQADELRREIDSNGKLVYNADTFPNAQPAVGGSMNSMASNSSNHQINGSISVKSNRIIINKPPPNYDSSQAAPNVPFIHNSNGVSRVFNLKPEKPTMMTKANGIRLGSTLMPRKERHRMGNKNFILNGNPAPLNSLNLVPQPSTSSSYLTFNITRNGLQSSLPLCSNVLPSQSPINHHHPQLIHTNPPLIPNSLPSANYVATKYVPINLLKPNDITSSHPNLSITESNMVSQPSQPVVRNYTKILPKSNANLVKLANPIPFMNHYLIPTTHNLVISPISHSINNISSTATTCPPGQTLSSVNFGPRTSVLPSLISKPNCESQQSILLKPNASVKQSTTLK